MKTSLLVLLLPHLALGVAASQLGKWKAGDWGSCELVPFPSDSAANSDIHLLPSLRPQLGFQRRHLACTDSAEPHNATNSGRCGSSDPQIMLHSTRSCVLKTDSTPVFSNWNAWRTLRPGCRGDRGEVYAEVQERSRALLRPSLWNFSRAELSQQRVSDQIEGLPLCRDLYRWLPSHWSQCMTADNYTCGGGSQVRRVTCLRREGSGVPVPVEYCEGLAPLPMLQKCEVPCPRDCQLSSWSSWTPCLTLDCTNEQGHYTPPSQIRAYRIRHRHMLVSPSAEGLSCPPLTQLQVCTPSPCYRWQPVTSNCQLQTGNECGTGELEVRLNCINSQGEVVDEGRCANLTKLILPVDSCHVTCPEDCAVSSWTAWSGCVGGIRKRQRNILGLPSEGGYLCPHPSLLVEKEECSEEITEEVISRTHAIYHWLALPWQACEGSCKQTSQEREVWCIKNGDERVDDEWCYYLPQPETNRTCDLPCPVNCTVSNWSEWSPCNCTECGGQVQRRYRIVLQEEAHGGLVCPQLSEERVCESHLHYRWNVSPWGLCVTGDGCGAGWQTRELSCRDEDDNVVQVGLCARVHLLPTLARKCWVACENTHCQFSEWSEWSACSENCQKRQIRFRAFIGRKETKDECESIYPTEETQSCPCENLQLLTGGWSHCLINSADGCGVGRKFQPYVCKSAWNQLEIPTFCKASYYQAADCQIPCSTDCQLGAWSEWTTCNSTCGVGFQNRTRRILSRNSKNGRGCSHLVEVLPCKNPDCDNFTWIEEPWSECYLDPPHRLANCGSGLQNRRVKCRNKQNNKNVEDSYCDLISKPAEVRICSVACVGECVYSEWTDWSPCLSCGLNDNRNRTRSVVRQGANFHNCTHLVEEESCLPPFRQDWRNLIYLTDKSVDCFRYEWAVTEWSSCLPLGGSNCGEGTSVRLAFCQREDGLQVPDKFCEMWPKLSPLEQFCYLDCPVDCQLSEWSEWDSSACICGYQTNNGALIRTRQVVIPANRNGKPCPEILEQRVPCPIIPCAEFRWEEDESCDLMGAQCGYGVRARNYVCAQLSPNRTAVRHIDTRFCEQHHLNWSAVFMASASQFQREHQHRYYLNSHSERMLSDKASMYTHQLPPSTTRSKRSLNAEEEDFTLGASQWPHHNWPHGPTPRLSVSLSQTSHLTRIPDQDPFQVSCFVSCDDCIQTEWTSWGPCVASCDYVPIRGNQKRTRLSCGQTVAESRACSPLDHGCWKLNQCHCPVAHARCTAEGECICAPGYRPLLAVRKRAFLLPLQSVKDNQDDLETYLVACEPDSTSQRDSTWRSQLSMPSNLKMTAKTASNAGSVATRALSAASSTVASLDDDIRILYYPSDDEFNVWMIAMIGIGCLFIIFVGVTIFLICSSREEPSSHHAVSMRPLKSQSNKA